MSFSSIIGSVELGLIFAILSLGIFVTFKILDFPDLTVDGSFTLGCVVSGICAMQGHPILGIIAGVLAGSAAGIVTGVLHTKLKVQYILAGILTMTALYSINLKIASGKPNFSLFGKQTIFTMFHDFLSNTLHIQNASILKFQNIILLIIIVGIVSILLYLFFKTQLGLALRATGSNEEMVKASSINIDVMKIIGLAIANAYVGLCASIFTQYQMFYDLSFGIGMMVVGLTSIIVGESIFGKRTILNSIISIVLGALIYRLLLTYALSIGMDPNDWKLMCVVLVIIVITLPKIKSFIKKRGRYVKN